MKLLRWLFPGCVRKRLSIPRDIRLPVESRLHQKFVASSDSLATGIWVTDAKGRLLAEFHREDLAECFTAFVNSAMPALVDSSEVKP